MKSRINQITNSASGTGPLPPIPPSESVEVDTGCAVDGKAPVEPSKMAARTASRSLFLVLTVVFILSLGMIHSVRFGEAYDDTIYVTAAKSIAAHGTYQLISLPQPLPQTLVPPLYPLVLSLIWGVSPFPGNLMWMMLLSAIAMVGFLALTARYLVSQNYATNWQALVIVVLAGVNWRMMTLGTSIISEVLFALLSVATLYFAERYESEERGWIGAAVGLLAGLAFLTRTSAIVLLISVTGYLLLRRRWRQAFVPLAVASIFVIAWMSWCYLNRNTTGGEHAAYYSGYASGIDATLSQLQTLNNVSKLSAQLRIVETNALALILVWMPIQSLGLRSSMPLVTLVPLLLSFLVLFTAGVFRELRAKVRLLHVFLLVYVALHLVPPSHSYERYLMPIVPFLLLFVVRESSILISTMGRAITSTSGYFKKTVPALIVLIFAATAMVALFSNATGLIHSLTSSKHNSFAAEDASAFHWIKENTNQSDVLICFADQKFYLYTGRKAVRSVPVSVLDLVVYQDREPASDEMVRTFSNIVEENRGSYFIFEAKDFEYQAPGYGAAIQTHVKNRPEVFIPEFSSASGNIVIYRISEHRSQPR